MTKIDITDWKSFKVSEIFETVKKNNKVRVPTGGSIAVKRLKDGGTPRVTVSNSNNGISGYYSDINDTYYRVYENFISVSFLGTVFYQPNRTSLDMKVHCLKPLEIKLNDNIAGFIASVIRESIANYMYDDQLSSEVLANLNFMLPADAAGNPNWAYMDSYMAKIFSEADDAIKKLYSVI